MRWVELPGAEPAHVFVHGLGASAAPYFTPAATHPALAGRRTLMVDLLGFGVSDRPVDFDYTMEAHADALAAVLDGAGVEGAEVVAHSMGGTVAVLLAVRHPRLVSSLVLVDANLDPVQNSRSGIASYTDEEFLAEGWVRTLERVGPHWAATMRLAGREALYRTTVHLTRADVRGDLLGLTIPRTFLYPYADGEPAGADGLRAGGVRVVPVADCGHNIMLDNVAGFVEAVASAGV